VLQLRALLLADHEQAIARKSRGRTEVGQRASRDRLRIGTGGMKQSGILAQRPNITPAIARDHEKVIFPIGTPPAATFARILMETLRKQLMQAVSIQADFPDAGIARIRLGPREAQSFSVGRELQRKRATRDRDQLVRLRSIPAREVNLVLSRIRQLLAVA
jgi:hypothetical protein